VNFDIFANIRLRVCTADGEGTTVNSQDNVCDADSTGEQNKNGNQQVRDWDDKCKKGVADNGWHNDKAQNVPAAASASNKEPDCQLTSPLAYRTGTNPQV
jgi:hypothetical protein